MSTAAPNFTTYLHIASTVLDWPQQERFMRFSGDRNPMHTDPLAARRTPPGDVVVYGMHMVLWALDSLVNAGHIDRSLSRLQVRFLKWIYLQDEATLWVRAATTKTPGKFEVRIGNMPAIGCVFTHGSNEQAICPGPYAFPIDTEIEETRSVHPQVLPMDGIEGRQGQVRLAGLSESEAMFPALAACFGPTLASEIATCSYIVGMKAPGLYSIDSSADWYMLPPAAQGAEGALAYRVAGLDIRFRRAKIQVSGSVLQGTLEAFVRHPPVPQARMEQVREAVASGEFEGVRALVVGGSRGLGEAAAKCIAAGGGHCIVTCVAGREDADRVAREIRDAGHSASVLHYDARKKAGPQLQEVQGPITHLLYFAGGGMSRANGALFSADRFAELTAIHVQGFHDLCVELLRQQTSPAVGRGLTAFYPSCAMLDDRGAGLTEFAASKAAGEQLCRDMAKFLPGLKIVTKRLPRLLTDQTAPMVPERFPDTVETILAVLRGL